MSSIALQSQEFAQRGDLLGEQLISRATDRIGDTILGIPGIFERIDERRFRQEQADRQLGVQQEQLGIQRDRLDLASDDLDIRRRAAESDILTNQVRRQEIQAKMEMAGGVTALKTQQVQFQMLEEDLRVRRLQGDKFEEEIKTAQTERGVTGPEDLPKGMLSDAFAQGMMDLTSSGLKFAKDVTREDVDKLRRSTKKRLDLQLADTTQQPRINLEAQLEAESEKAKITISQMPKFGPPPPKLKAKLEGHQERMSAIQERLEVLGGERTTPLSPQTSSDVLRVIDEVLAPTGAGAPTPKQGAPDRGPIPSQGRPPLPDTFPKEFGSAYNSPVFAEGSDFLALAKAFGMTDFEFDPETPFWKELIWGRELHANDPDIMKMLSQSQQPVDPMLSYVQMLVSKPALMELFLRRIGASEEQIQAAMKVLSGREDG